MQGETGKCGSFFMPMERKYTSGSKGFLFIEQPYTYCAILKSKRQDSILTEKRHSNLILL